MADPDLDHFLSIPWCADLIQRPNTTTKTAGSRQPKTSTEDSLLAETLATDSTIKACLLFYPTPIAGTTTRVEEVSLLFTLGHGVNGWANTLHGGIVATTVDEAMGMLVSVNKRIPESGIKMPTLTAFLNVQYLKKIETPSTVVVTARFQEVKGRKYFVEAFLRDGEGVVRAKAEALFVGPRRVEGKL